MNIDGFIDWVKAVNSQSSNAGNCLSCFDIPDQALNGMYLEGVTPKWAAIKIATQFKKKDICPCQRLSDSMENPPT